eukprot:GHVS01099204.1.p1 GENE.GHVS01099204.1~~GHVS01099204.1.p1  ORF type:complete len:612 (-),score=155.82 GHVS01099204.1:35-1870(-)
MLLTSKTRASSSGSSKKEAAAVKASVRAMLEHLQPKIKQVHEKDSSAISRSLQACLKHGSDLQRTAIIKALCGVFPQLSVQKYGHKLALKMLLYADKATQQSMWRGLLQPDIVFNKFGSRLFEYAYLQPRSPIQQREMLYAVLLPPLVKIKLGDVGGMAFSELLKKCDESTRERIMEALRNCVQRAVDKELLDKVPMHTAFKWLLTHTNESEHTPMVETVLEGAIHLTASKDGVECLIRLLGYATAKQRKQFVKLLKTRVHSICASDFGCLAIMRLLSTVDDTKLLVDAVLKELIMKLDDVCFHRHAHKVLLYVMAPDASRYLTQAEKALLSLPSPTSLKPAHVRRAALMEWLLAPLAERLLLPPADAVGVGRATKRRKKEQGEVGGVVTQQQLQDGHQQHHHYRWLIDTSAQNVLVEFLTAFGAPRTGVVEARLIAGLKAELMAAPPPSDESSSFHHPVAHRAIQRIIKSSSSSHSNTSEEHTPPPPPPPPPPHTPPPHTPSADTASADTPSADTAASSFAVSLCEAVVEVGGVVGWLIAGRGVFVLRAMAEALQTARGGREEVMMEELRKLISENLVTAATDAAEKASQSTAGLKQLQVCLRPLTAAAV